MPRVPANPARANSPRSPPAIVISGEGEHHALSGSLVIGTLATARDSLKSWSQPGASCTLDVAGITRLDTPGALFLAALRNMGVALTGMRPEHQILFDLVASLELKPLPAVASVPRWRQLVTALGKSAHDAGREAYSLVTFIGRVASWTCHAALHPTLLRPASISRHVRETGIQALPIIGLMAVMIAIVIGYQGVAQLRQYGGEDLTINLVAVSVLREMGVLITSIMVAGRSGSAYTAEIGVMKTRDEVDALTVMGLEPMQMLVLPRVIALVLTLPVLAFFADIMGLMGGAAIAQVLLHVSPAQYLTRLPQVVSLSDLMVGLFKAPIFAFCIAVIACMHGLRVSGTAESVGRETTRSVVKSIFLVLVLDALFSILFEKLGV
ncbi:MlaE family lipid ABC transporter permease subunit [Pseudoduganella sp. S-14]|jgi:phospholipid/cholesterol/gamma-HCH transport system permease protein|uniref:ABC transporter permease n=1 Tax=Pseudoduganella sp. S-14 TaxID=3404065 RepID=UPI003CF7D34C